MKNVKIIKALQSLAATNGGLLLPETVVTAAKDKRSPLHRKFTWKDDEAAHQWRLQQARMLINTAVEILPATTHETPIWVSLSTDRQTHNGYRATIAVCSDEELREQLLKDALHDLSSWQQRYRALKELTDIFKAADSVRHKHAA